MIITKEGERLYFASWEYNCARILTELAKLVKDKGGEVKQIHTAVISNRTLTTFIHEKENRIQKIKDRIKENNDDEKRLKLLQTSLQSETEDLARGKGINNDPITVTHTTYMHFKLNDDYYYYQADDNCFFPFLFQKSRIIDGNKYTPVYLSDDPKGWFDDSLLSFGVTDKQIHEFAEKLLGFLLKAPYSKRYKNTPKTIDW